MIYRMFLNYGITERQLLKYVRSARRIKGSTGEDVQTNIEYYCLELVNEFCAGYVYQEM